ncbi:MAG: cytochrome C [Gammaproteobacteria bacterium]|nr:cytochrome C [Gammaproteobacteria bacterium]
MFVVRVSRLLFGLAMFLGLPSTTAAFHFGPLEKMVMPGELIKGHAELEKECLNCHVYFKKEAQPDLCLDCHDHRDVAEDIATGRGYHGRLEDNRCKPCHDEHQGRNMNIAPFDKKTFDHYSTDYPLEGAHVDPKVKCEDCHKPRLKYRDAPSTCYGCHKKDSDDAHKGKKGKDCVKCHVDSNWKEIRFDHSETDFPLEGRHLFLKCDDCHVDERHEGTPKRCYACHKKDDNKKGHKGRRGKKCDTCHIPDKWGMSIFDHARDTEFPLKGKHRRAKCTACHKEPFYKDKVKLKTNCYACHESDDDEEGHKGERGEECETCHTPRDWKRIVFDHNRGTDYPLRGKHREIECKDCHEGVFDKEELKTDCFSCHEQDDAHKGQQGEQCERCHNEQSWKEKVFFDHGLTRFPLLGKHAEAVCEDCHQDTAYKDADIACLSCHKENDEDVHKRRLGPLCDQCHDPRDWQQWHFDHNTQTDFPLDGEHEGLHCHACHRTRVKKKIRESASCVSCHRADDIHRGDFGRVCERCHVASSFSDVDKTLGTIQ